MKLKLRIIHETNPKKYFPALYGLARDGRLRLVGEHRYSVVKEWLRAWLVDGTPLMERTENACGDLAFRLRIPFIHGETILIGFAPWDWRLLIYGQLAKNNRVIYHTSWHDWQLDKTPRQLSPPWFQRFMQRRWHEFVRHPNVTVVAVTATVADTVAQHTGVNSTIIPHAVPRVFFEARKSRSDVVNGPLRLIYVGELSEKKGLLLLLDAVQILDQHDIKLTIVGNGPLAHHVREVAGDRIRYLGPVYDRQALAQIMAEHDVLALLSQRTKAWEELFGIVIIEAIAAGLAVVASDHVGPRSILGIAGGEGLLDGNSREQIVRTICKLSSDREYLSKMAAQQSSIASSYTEEAVAEVWWSLLTNVLPIEARNRVLNKA